MDATSTIAAKATAVSAVSAMSLSELFYSDPNFSTAIIVGFFTGIAALFLEYAHLDEEIRKNTTKMKIASSLIVGIMTVIGIVGTFMYGAGTYLSTIEVDVPRGGLIFFSVLLGLAKKEVINTFKNILSSLGNFFNRGG